LNIAVLPLGVWSDIYKSNNLLLLDRGQARLESVILIVTREIRAISLYQAKFDSGYPKAGKNSKTISTRAHRRRAYA
jgi:hypothetical protein